MTMRKHNEFLDTGDSECDDRLSIESDSGEIIKGARKVKRKKVDETCDRQDEEGLDPEESQSKRSKTVTDTSKTSDKAEYLSDERNGSSKPLLRKNLITTTTAIKRSGVIYLSRIPPYMKPRKLRSLLEPYGTINRIFLTPEDPTLHSRRVRYGGNKKRSFVDGWVEFVNKADAKAACELLNARTIGGKKGTYYHDDVWNLLYLKGFKWSHLTEQIATENAERASRMRAEISKTTKENKEFVKNVEKAKMLEGIKTKKEAKMAKITQAGNLEEGFEKIKKINEPTRSFKQKPVAPKISEIQEERVQRVLSKIF